MNRTTTQIILIGNYLPDRLESMIRFSSMLNKNLKNKNLNVKELLPKVVFGRFVSKTHMGIGKWIAYIDKFILFPIVLIIYSLKFKFSSKKYVFHICDHSNAMYAFFLPKSAVMITCHDVLAIRGSMGFTDSYCESSPTGKILQKWIFYSLKKIRKIAFVSKFTLGQFKEIYPNAPLQYDYKLIYCSFSSNFYPLDLHLAYEELKDYPVLINTPFVLHVGNGHKRKNRILLIEFLIKVKDSWNGNICFVGEDLDSDSLALVNQYQLSSRIIVFNSVSNHRLLALYRLCNVFMFPSFSEGFGMPALEAQACGTPLITSSIEPMPEISGPNSIFANPNNPNDFVDAFMYLQDENNRKKNIEFGFENIKRFELDKVINSYIEFYFSNSNV